MRKIDKPIITVSDILIDCIINMQDKRLKKTLTDSISVIENAEIEFDKKIRTNTLYRIPHNQEINRIANASSLKKIYTDRMVKKDNNGRKYYDLLLLSAPKGKCPLCSQRQATTLDHYLPKSIYPLLSVTPINLVPSCKDCNTGKLTDYPTQSNEETLHPYYDDVEAFSWLKMKLIRCKPIIVIFSVSPPQGISKVLKERMEHHLLNFKLNELYTSHAIEEFENVRQQLTKLYENGGKYLLKEHLKECFESREAILKNSWQTAFYKELMENDEFCNGAFI